jgi:CHAD domain-containing protein
MTFSFKRRESVRKGVRRLGRKRLKHAMKCLDGCEEGEAIHTARKDIKKVRALLDLVCTQLKRKDFRRTNNQLRKAAKCLAKPRDASVREKTLTELTSHYKGQLKPHVLARVKTKMHELFKAEMRRFTSKKVNRTVSRRLARAAKELKSVKFEAEGLEAISQGCKASYAAGQRAYQRVLEERSPENLHAWRKRVKTLWYQVTLLRRVWPEQMDALAHEAEMLGEALGDDHDLVMLHDFLQDVCCEEVHDLETIDAIIEHRRGELQADAMAIGKRFFAEKPSAFCKRLARYWEIWQGERNASNRHAVGAL